MIKVGLIGIGGMGFVHFSRYKELKGAEIVAVADVRCDMAKEKIADEKIRVYSSMEDLLEHEDVDMVDICTPSYMHADMAIYAMKKGKHVLCEKPMCLNSEDTQRVLNVAKETGKFFMTAHVVRFMAPYKALKNVIDSGELGKPIHITLKRVSKTPRWSWENWMRDRKKSGGAIIDLSIHDIDFAQYVFGEPKVIRSTLKEEKDNREYHTSEFIYDSHSVSIYGGWFNLDDVCNFFSAEYLAFFENGTLELKGGKLYKNKEEIDLGGAAKTENTGINISSSDGYGEEIEYFVSCVEKGVAPTMVTPESSARSISLAERILNDAYKF